MKTDELREKYLSFFESKDHVRRASDVLVPTWDPSVLFTPAGMNQFKDHFLGKVKLEFSRATTSQKCLRTGDIENVGRTPYHHTFFEMLGNFSFGDYFKREAITWAWEFLTRKEWLGLDPKRLSASVYFDDQEAAKIWHDDIGLPSSRIEQMGEDENYWPANAPSQGPDGVCGPCSEVFFHPDRGTPVEIWNLVFTQYNRVGDPPDNLRPLPSRNIDTGMGLERTAAVLQGVDSNFHIDILRPIVEAAAEVSGVKYVPDNEAGRRLRRITDHVRACCFAIHENVYPGPNKEKYVIRRLLRRAVLDGHQLGREEPFLHLLVPAVVDAMRGPYPEMQDTVDRVQSVIRQEEENFFATIDDGLARIQRIFDDMKHAGRMAVDGQKAAELYQTYGVPPELVESMAAEGGLAFDWDGFTRAMGSHGKVSGRQQFELFKTGPIEAIKKAIHVTEFLGYEVSEATAEVKAIIVGDQLCDQLTVTEPTAAVVVLDRSPFYGEAGGQVGDTGQIIAPCGSTFEVEDTQRDGNLILHHGKLASGGLATGAQVTARVDASRRQSIRRAHSATHLLHHALQTHLGSHAQQQGSKVDQDWLRFDFTNLSPIPADQLASIEDDVQQKITRGDPIRWDVVPLAEARQAGAMMLFGEKYPDPVRMVSMGSFSRELCGGTHLEKTSDVGPFEIISEESVSAGTRRITALTGEKAAAHRQRTRAVLEQAAEQLAVPPLAVPGAVAALSPQVRELKKCLAGGGQPPAATSDPAAGTPPAAANGFRAIKAALQETARTLNVAPQDVADRTAGLLKEARQLRAQLDRRDAQGPLSADDLLGRAESIDGTTVVIAEAAGAPPGVLRKLIDQLRAKAAPVAVLLASTQAENKVTLVAGISRDLESRGVSANDWVREVAAVVNGSGGGRADMAQAGGKSPEKLPRALETARQTIANMLGA